MKKFNIILKSEDSFGDECNFEIQQGKNILGAITYVSCPPDESGIWYFPKCCIIEDQIIDLVSGNWMVNKKMELISDYNKHYVSLTTKKQHIREGLNNFLTK